MGLQRTPLSLHLTILEKESLTLCSKRFSKLSSKIFVGFYFEVCREPIFLCILQSLKRGRWHYVPKGFTSYHPKYLWVFILRFVENPSFSASYNPWKGVYETIHQKFFQLIIQNICGFLFWGLQRIPSFSASYNLWKGVYETINKSFYKLSSKIFMGFYLWVCRERV